MLLRYYSKKSDEDLLISIQCLYWLQMWIAIVVVVALLILGLGFYPAFGLATWQLIARLPVFAMGVCAGVLCLRHPHATDMMPWFSDDTWYLPIRYLCSCNN